MRSSFMSHWLQNIISFGGRPLSLVWSLAN